MTKRKKIHWQPEYYLYIILKPKRVVLIRDIEDSQQHEKDRKNHDYHGVQTQAAYYCEIALKCLVAALGEQPKTSTHNLQTLYSHAAQLYSGDLDRDIQTRIEKLAESAPVLKGFHFAKPSRVTATARDYYTKSRYPKAVRSGQWTKPQLAPNHLFAVGDGAAALTDDLLRSSSASI